MKHQSPSEEELQFARTVQQAEGGRFPLPPEKCSERKAERMKNKAMQKILQAETGAPLPARSPRKNLRAIVAVAICSVLLLTSAVAVAPAVWNYLNLGSFETPDIGHLTEAPEGFTAVTTLEELEAIRQNPTGSYILMNDLTFPEGQLWIPIDGFRGTFEGNGYVIRNLQIDVTSSEQQSHISVGLFGATNIVETQKGDRNDFCYVDGAIIRNLGVSGGFLHYAGTVTQNLYVGAIAGNATMVAGCFVEDFDIIVRAENPLDADYLQEGRAACIGAVAGQTYITDSCWSDASLDASGVSGFGSTYLCGVVGESIMAAVTSYFNGTITGEEADGVSHVQLAVPIFINETIYNEVLNRLGGEPYKPHPAQNMDVRKIQAYYADFAAKKAEAEEQLAANIGHEVKYHKDGLIFLAEGMDPQNYFVHDISQDEQTLYLLDPYLKYREWVNLAEIFGRAFPDGDFAQYCLDNGVKCGKLYCYDLRQGESDFAGFNVERIWTQNGDSLPTLRRFDA